MPLVRISLRAGTDAAFRAAVSEGVHEAMVTAIAVPPADRFQVITEHGAGALIYDPSYLGIERSPGIVIVQITLNAGRTIEQKKALYARIADNLARSPGVRRQDVLVNLVEVAKENWSFGNGEAQYAK
jgi:phenylpyruvate tautomerase PptA (4-oxalocrotonate tautomerase family)